MLRRKILLIILILFALSACGTYSMEGADQLSENEVATLDTKIQKAFDPIHVSFIDGKSRGVGSFKIYKLVPGERVITVTGNQVMRVLPNYTDVVFNAEAGKEYKLKFISHGGDKWSCEIIEKSTGERVDFEQTNPRCWHPGNVGSLKCEHKRAYLNNNK